MRHELASTSPRRAASSQLFAKTGARLTSGIREIVVESLGKTVVVCTNTSQSRPVPRSKNAIRSRCRLHRYAMSCHFDHCLLRRACRPFALGPEYLPRFAVQAPGICLIRAGLVNSRGGVKRRGLYNFGPDETCGATIGSLGVTFVGDGSGFVAT
jgi:hypothetical protein